jgi:hypothetical protein
MFSDQRSLRAVDICHWRERFAGVTPIQALALGESSVCVGVVERIRVAPHEPVVVTIEDGTGRLTARFTSRMRLHELRLGHGIQLCGTVAEDAASRPVMVEPAWIAITQ